VNLQFRSVLGPNQYRFRVGYLVAISATMINSTTVLSVIAILLSV
jgi:hypothetical protein